MDNYPVTHKKKKNGAVSGVHFGLTFVFLFFLPLTAAVRTRHACCSLKQMLIVILLTKHAFYVHYVQQTNVMRSEERKRIVLLSLNGTQRNRKCCFNQYLQDKRQQQQEMSINTGHARLLSGEQLPCLLLVCSTS